MKTDAADGARFKTNYRHNELNEYSIPLESAASPFSFRVSMPIPAQPATDAARNKNTASNLVRYHRGICDLVTSRVLMLKHYRTWGSYLVQFG